MVADCLLLLGLPAQCTAVPRGLSKTEYLDYFLIQSVVVINQIRQGLELDLSVHCQSNFYLRQHSNLVMDFGDKKLNGISLLNIINISFVNYWSSQMMQ